MSKEIKRIEIDNEIIYLKKNDILGWKVVYPIKKDINKPMTRDNINWKNLISGGKWDNLLFIGIFVALAVACIIEYTKIINAAKECMTQLNAFNIRP